MNDIPKLSIDSLNLDLPPGFGPRAERIARLTARQIAGHPLGQDFFQESLTVPAISLAGGDNDYQIARRIANALSNQITAVRRAGGGNAG